MTEDSKKIRTIKNFTEHKFKEKGSVFIGQAFSLETEEEFSKKIVEIRKRYYDASHHCYAYRFLESQVKYSDDGEPNGTAGIRILNAIQHFDLINLAVIVIRYFGGTKLGVGPLGKAYYNSAFEVLKLSDKFYKTKFARIKISYTFELTNLVHHYISLFSAKIETNLYNDTPSIICLLEENLLKKFSNDLFNASKGKIKSEFQESIFI